MALKVSLQFTKRGLQPHRRQRFCYHFTRNYASTVGRGFGLCFDVDGVLSRGQHALPATKPAIDLLCDQAGNFKVPVTFVTNSVSSDVTKAERLSSFLGVEVTPGQIVQAHGPLTLMTELHKKTCLILGQGPITQLAMDIGFQDVCTLDDIRECYPELDVMEHKYKFALPDVIPRKPMKKIDAVVCLNEPIQWEGALQITTDVLTTRGQLEQPVQLGPQMPILACNVDLQYMDRGHIPRYGNGAFLCCLEALYKKLTGHELHYTVLSGKPGELTFQFAEYRLQTEAARLGIDVPIERMYMVGDNPVVDIVGANLYHEYVTRRSKSQPADGNTLWLDSSLPQSRQLPLYVDIPRQTVEVVYSLLVETGVYEPSSGQSGTRDAAEEVLRQEAASHKDFAIGAGLLQPTRIFDDVLGAVKHILEREEILASK